MSSPKSMRLGIVQCALGDTTAANLLRVFELMASAAESGASVILTPELFDGSYFPQHERESNFARAHPLDEHPTLLASRELCARLGVVAPISLFERDGPHYYNTLVLVGVAGELLGTYRKSHIPDGPGYEEKFYFRPGNSGFRVFQTPFGALGLGVCWDQWFPECARALTLAGADVLLYPTAIGTEPEEPELNTRDPWRRAMQGHAVSNVIPVAAANRVGEEDAMRFYGSSFIVDQRGDELASLSEDEEGFRVVTLDLARARSERAAWGFFRDRRPELYGSLTEP
ncbi:MAG: N-carbamoylputrescine amidase [Deltaproteobacteria bacterium]|nr:N-carbamoylputrescine amidase [Deltaproteobacteria bacterium]